MASVATRDRTAFVPVPVSGLAASEALDFPLYLTSASGERVLYKGRRAHFDAEHAGRLLAEGVDRLFVPVAERRAYFRRVEASLGEVLRDPSIEIEVRAQILHGVASEVCRDLVAQEPGPADIDRARRLFTDTSALVERDHAALTALRRVLGGSQELGHHSLSVGVLTMGVWRLLEQGGPQDLVEAGLAGALHDIGRAGRRDVPEEEDPEHTVRGHDILLGLGMSEPIRLAALHHHERMNGQGYPSALRGGRLPVLSRVVAMVDTFESLYSSRNPRVGVFDTLRVMAQVYRGCFDDRVVGAFLRMFQSGGRRG